MAFSFCRERGREGASKMTLGGEEKWMGANGIEPVAQTLGLGL
jgi:hypothetical protein